MSDEKEKSSPEETLMMIESGYLDLNQQFQEAILLLGRTKAGKTTTAHHLTHQLLESGFNSQKELVYKLAQVNNENYQRAFIGDHPRFSETQIPNIFNGRVNGKEFHLIDCPGYIDTHGCYRITSNRFFHYQVLSNVKKVKFIITFRYVEMQSTGDLMLKTFKEFLKGFYDIQSIKQQIMNATCVMITGVPVHIDSKELTRKFADSAPLKGEFGNFYSQMRAKITKEEKVFGFYQPTAVGEKCNINNTLLEQIHNKTVYWQRKRDELLNQIDMNNISINILRYIDQEGELQFLTELDKFCEYYNKIFGDDIKKLQDVVVTFRDDIIKESNQFKFSNLMVAEAQKKLLEIKKNTQCAKLYNQYQEKRKKAKKELTATKTFLGGQSVDLHNDIPIWAHMISAHYKIEQLIEKLVFNGQFDFKFCVQAQNIIKVILNILLNITKLNRVQKQQNNLLNFCYEIYKGVNISLKLFRLMTVSSLSDLKISKEGKSQAFKSIRNIITKFPKDIKQLFNDMVGKTTAQILEQKIDHIKFEEIVNPKIASHLVEVLRAIKEGAHKQIKQIEENHDIKQSQKNIAQKLKKLIPVIEIKSIELENLKFDGFRKEKNMSLVNLKEMEAARSKICLKIIESKKRAEHCDQLIIQNNRIVNLMADCLYKHNRVELALELYELLMDGHMVLKIMEKEIEVKNGKKEHNASIADRLIKYSQSAYKYHRYELAITIAQEAYHLSQEKGMLTKTLQVKKLIKKICEKTNGEPDILYNAMKDKLCEVRFTQQISEKILSFALGYVKL